MEENNEDYLYTEMPRVRIVDILEAIVYHRIRVELMKHPFVQFDDVELEIDHIRAQIENMAFKILIGKNATRKRGAESLLEWCSRANFITIDSRVRTLEVSFVSKLLCDYLAARHIAYQKGISAKSDVLSKLPARVVEFVGDLVRINPE